MEIRVVVLPNHDEFASGAECRFFWHWHQVQIDTWNAITILGTRIPRPPNDTMHTEEKIIPRSELDGGNDAIISDSTRTGVPSQDFNDVPGIIADRNISAIGTDVEGGVTSDMGVGVTNILQGRCGRVDFSEDSVLTLHEDWGARTCLRTSRGGAGRRGVEYGGEVTGRLHMNDEGSVTGGRENV